MDRMYRKVKDASSRGEKLPTSNLYFYGSKMDICGNSCAVFSFGANGRKWSVQTEAFDEFRKLRIRGNERVEEILRYCPEEQIEQAAIDYINKWGSNRLKEQLYIYDSARGKSRGRRIKDEYGSELDFAGESIKIGVDFNFDSYLFEQNYEEDYDGGEYGLDEEIDWDLVNDICADVEDKLCGVIGGYFGDKHYCSYFHGGRFEDDTCYELVVEDSILIDKLTYELPVENVEDWENGVLDFYLLNNNSDLSSIWGNSVYEALEGKYSDDKTRRVLSDVIEVYLMGADILVYEPTQAIIALAEELR